MNGGEESTASATRASSSNRNMCMNIGGGAGGNNVAAAPTAAAAGAAAPATPSRYEAQKRRDWNTFGQYLKNHRPPLPLARCGGANVLEFLRYLDQFGKTKVHLPACPYFGLLHPPSPCTCPLRQAWGSLDALIGRLRAAYEENGGKPETNPFGARVVRTYLREVREHQARARGISHHKKKRKPRPPAGSTTSSSAQPPPLPAVAAIVSATVSNPSSSLDSIEPLMNHSMYNSSMMMVPPEDSHLRLLRS